MFERWLEEIDRLAAVEGCSAVKGTLEQDVTGSYTQQTGPDCWKQAYDDGLTPAEAWAEEKSYAYDC